MRSIAKGQNGEGKNECDKCNDKNKRGKEVIERKNIIRNKESRKSEKMVIASAHKDSMSK